uniref:RNA-directed DNA polymerase n=1 Tax=Meloidogyne incognita TaxID=6306 RepID=A0A914LN86_MELIC
MQVLSANANNSAAASLASVLDSRIGKFYYEPEAGQTFEVWYKRYSNFFLEEGKSLDDSAKVRLLVGKIGECEYATFSNAVLPSTPDQLKFKDAVSKLKDLFGDKRSLFVRRYECFKIQQQQGQDISSYVASVNASCENADLTLTKEALKCLIMVVGLRDEYHDLRQKCLQLLEDARRRNDNFTLEKLGEECRAYMLIRESAHSLSNANPSQQSINAIQSKPRIWREKPKKKSPRKIGGTQSKETHPSSTCYCCGKQGHWRKDCRFKDATCKRCYKKGHLVDNCRSKTRADDRNTRRINTVSTYCLAMEAKNPDWFLVKLEINGVDVEMKLDTASQITLVTTRTWKKLGCPELQMADLQVKNCNDIAFDIQGKFECSVQFNGAQRKTLTAYTCNSVAHDLLGIPWICELQILAQEMLETFQRSTAKISVVKENKIVITDANELKESLQSMFPSVFDLKLGLCTKLKAQLHLKADARPIFCKARPVPFGALEAINEELDRLLTIGAIKPVEFSQWAAPILAVKKKSGKTRVCIDFSTGLNNALELNRHPLPRPDDIYASLNGAKHFSQLDLRDAYLQIELDEKSKGLCGINTHRGLMQCQRLPFGVKSAPSIFQHVMDQMLSGIPGTYCYLDDLIIASPSIEKHAQTIQKLFAKIQEYGFKIQAEKCHFLQSEIKFLGHLISAEGIKPDPARSEAIRKMPAPHDVSSLRSFLGALNYYGRFIRSMCDLRAPLDELLRKDVIWEWTEKQQSAFEKAKEILVSPLLLTHYDPSLPIIVAADASKDGIGIVLSHKFPNGTEKAVEHGAVTFTPAQRNYSQIEKEALALVFAVQKFHRMIYGRHFTLLTDHKPLLAIFGSKTGIPIYSASRLQRWAIILSNYNFDIKYVKTTAFGKADVLSRLIANYPRPEEDILIANISADTECFVNKVFGTVTNDLPISANEIANETENDLILQKLLMKIRGNWEVCKDTDLLPYFPKRREISEIKGCLIYGQRTIIPEKLRSKMLKTLHFAHPGIVKMKLLAKEHVYWPKMNSDIERLVKECQNCQETAKVPIKAKLAPWKITEEVFQRVHMDFAGPCMDGYTYLLLVDSYSKWPEVFRMTNISAKATVDTLRTVIHRLGIPKELVSDNGTQFRSTELAKFCKEYDIKHTFTPPFHPQSNGQVERFVDTFKRGMKKAKEDKFWCEKMLLAYRSTPHTALNGCSPDQLFLGRRLRTKISLVHPEGLKLKKTKFSKSERIEYTQKMASQFDKKHGTKNIEFSNGEAIYALNYRFGKTHWLPGEIISKVKNSPTYRVSIPSIGRNVHRHTNQLRKRLQVIETEVMAHEDEQVQRQARTPAQKSPAQENNSETRRHQIERDQNVQKTPRRYPNRDRRQVHHLDMDPRKKRYEKGD